MWTSIQVSAQCLTCVLGFRLEAQGKQQQMCDTVHTMQILAEVTLVTPSLQQAAADA